MAKLNDKIWKQVFNEQFNENFKSAVRDGRIKGETKYWLETCEKMVKRALTISNSQNKKRSKK